jgi:hypothetical protein
MGLAKGKWGLQSKAGTDDLLSLAGDAEQSWR